MSVRAPWPFVQPRAWAMFATVLGVTMLSFGLAWSAAAQPIGCEGAPYAEAAIVGAPRVELEVVETPDDMARGLMFRESLPWDRGMLFIFPQPTRGGFWMQNTLIPLSIAFIQDDGTIVDIQDMQPLTTDTHAPPAAYRYAIETNQGWYAANNVTPGDRLLLCLGR